MTCRGGGARRPPIGRCWRRGAAAAQWARGAQVPARLSARGARRGASPPPPDTRPGRRAELRVPHPPPAWIAPGAPCPRPAVPSARRDAPPVGPLSPGTRAWRSAALPRLGFRCSSARTLEVRAAGAGGRAPGFSCSPQSSAPAVAEVPRAARSPPRPRPRSRRGSPAERPRRDWEGPALADVRRC